MKSTIEQLCFEATISAHGGSFRVGITTTPLERALLDRGIISLDELVKEYRKAIERGEYTTYGFC